MEIEDHEGMSRRIQVLSTEQWSLITLRSNLWNEAFSRATMYLAVLSATVVALALVAQATDFGDSFLRFSLLLLPVVLIVGVSTFVRITHANVEDKQWLIAMNRIRRAYLDIAPELEPYFTTGSHDDEPGLVLSTGTLATRRTPLHGMVTSAGLVAVMNAVVGAVFLGLAADEITGSPTAGVVAGVATFALLVLLQANYYHRAFVRFDQSIIVRFPTPDNTGG
ncbi:MAG: hypothetical protein WAN48_14105 [Actinomycetes bacterium]